MLTPKSPTAHATQTGKGLLYYTKRAEDKGHPSAILNLVSILSLPISSIADLRFQGEITDLVKEGLDVLTFKIHGHKHALQAPSRAERDGWFAAIEAKSEEAKAAHEGLVGSEGYKSQLEKFGKSPFAQAGLWVQARHRSPLDTSLGPDRGISPSLSFLLSFSESGNRGFTFCSFMAFPKSDIEPVSG